MKSLTNQILKKGMIKNTNDLFEITIQQDIINSDTRIVNKSAIQLLINKVIKDIRKCTNNKDGDYYYQVRTNEHEVFNSDIILHRIIFVAKDIGWYKKCVSEKMKIIIRKNHDKGDIKFIADVTQSDVNNILKNFTKNSSHRETWSKDAFFEFYHEDMVELTKVPYIKIDI